MTPEQLKMLLALYLKASTRPDKKASTLAESIRFMLDGDIDLVNSKDCVFIDETNNMIHAIYMNEDMAAQASFPVKVLSADFSIIQKVEAIFSQENFEKLLDEGFGDLSKEKIEFIKKYTRSRSNFMQAQQPMEAEPFFKNEDEPKTYNMPHKRIERNDTVVEEPKDDTTEVKETTPDNTTDENPSVDEDSTNNG